MKIKSLGWSSFCLSNDNMSILTDPVALKESGIGLPKCKADVVLFSQRDLYGKEDILREYELEKKIEPDHRDNIFEISSPGEYEIGGMMIRRGIDLPFYTIDEGNLRVVYMGVIDNSLDVSKTKDLGDVDVLILPIGNGDLFIDYEKIEKILNYIDPTVLLPCAYKTDGLKVGKDIKSRDDFIKYFGFTNVKEQSSLNVTSTVEQESKIMEVIFLN
ncbi:MAG TPA: MBL fold metallo-hydrolase [Candidatus Dojkabacteria bacterium]|nr:MBL fold metallo-hydrolase [Candidatus Dojkabacteria bacterium]HPM13815.1 MBL fold metallo-hydrolase [Candidatus Dojkabacteria bacterium]HQA87580.1 MBL fold metallo-hydrolase [Candidatus Dojkabacteria bacterium]